MRQNISTAPANHAVRAVLHCPVAEAQDRIGPWANLHELSGGRCRLAMSTDSLEWAAMALGSTGVEATDVAPPQLVALLRDWSERFARAADDAIEQG